MARSLDIFSTQCSPVHRVGMHVISNPDTHLYLPHDNSSVHLTTTELQRSGQITDGMRSCWRTLQDLVLSSLTLAPSLLEWSRQKQRAWLNRIRTVVGRFRSTNGVWPLLRPVSVAQKNKPSTTLSPNTQFIDLPVDCTA